MDLGRGFFSLSLYCKCFYSITRLICVFSQRVEVERTLTDSQRDEFEDMLRALTLERSQIKEAMGFALDNADAAGEVMPTLISLSFFLELNIMNSFCLDLFCFMCPDIPHFLN